MIPRGQAAAVLAAGVPRSRLVGVRGYVYQAARQAQTTLQTALRLSF